MMKLTYKNSRKSNYSSIIPFEESIEITDYTVLTGKNGSGKTHILEAINRSDIEIEGIKSAEIVYYNYNTFQLSSSKNKSDSNNTNNIYDVGTMAYRMSTIEDFRREIVKELKTKTNIPLKNCLLRIMEHDGFNFEEYFGYRKDFENLKNLETIDNSEFTPYFRAFIMECRNNEINLKELKENEVRETCKQIIEEMEESLKSLDEEFYNSFKTPNKEIIFWPRYDDIENMDLILENIIDEEELYHNQKEELLLKEVQNFRKNEQTKFLENCKDQKIGNFVQVLDDYYSKENGSPLIEEINSILKEYDCNGYSLKYREQNSNTFEEDKTARIVLENNEGIEVVFDGLSSGEKTLIALTFIIYKFQKRKITPRVLLLDEIDASLHPPMIRRLINVIQNVLIGRKNLKVILATHSPTTVALSPDDSIFLVDNTERCPIQKIEKSEAIEILAEGLITINEKEANLGIQYNISRNELPVLFTEGITDKIIIETAWKKLRTEEMPFLVQDCYNASLLKTMFARGNDNPDGLFVKYPDRKLISLFDFDEMGIGCWNKLDMDIIEADEKKCKTKKKENRYSILIPVKEMKNCKNPKFSIECLIPDVEYSSKRKKEFAINTDNLEKEKFKDFEPLFEKINEIIQEKN